MSDSVKCTKCGTMKNVEANSLTDTGKRSFKCPSCQVEESMPMESKIAERQNVGKKLLTEDLPNIQ